MRLASAIRHCVPLSIPLLLLSAAWAEEKKDDRPRFVDRGEYIEDTTTKLLWQKDGASAGKRNFQQAAEYAKGLKLGGLTGWRVPTAKELAGIFPADQRPFLNSKYNPNACCGGPKEFASFWTCELDPRLDDYAYVYQWYAKGGANNGFASKNFIYVRCVRDIDGAELAAEVKSPALKLDEKTLQKATELIAQLADDSFEKREAATKELATLGPVLEALLTGELEQAKDLDVRLRLKGILDAIRQQ